MKSAKMKMSRNTVYQAAAMFKEPQNRLLHDSPHCTLPDPLAASIGSSIMASSASVNAASWCSASLFSGGGTKHVFRERHRSQGDGVGYKKRKSRQGNMRQPATAIEAVGETNQLDETVSAVAAAPAASTAHVKLLISTKISNLLRNIYSSSTGSCWPGRIMYCTKTKDVPVWRQRRPGVPKQSYNPMRMDRDLWYND